MRLTDNLAECLTATRTDEFLFVLVDLRDIRIGVNVQASVFESTPVLLEDNVLQCELLL